MTGHEFSEYEVRYDAVVDEELHDVEPEHGESPDDPPAGCSLCHVNVPRWWYRVDKWHDEPGRLHGLAFARWWAMCSACHEMLLAEDAEALSARVQFDADFPRELLPDFMRLAHMTGEIESA